MSNSMPKYTQVRDCTLDPGNLYKITKFSDKSTGSRLSTIKACVNGNSTADSTFKGSGMGGSSAGFRKVLTSGGRTNRLSSLVTRHSNNEKKLFEAQNKLTVKENEKKKRNKRKKK